MSEIALVSAKKARLLKLAEDGDSKALTALKLGENPTEFMSTIQIGITAIGILNGIFGESVLADPLAAWILAHSSVAADIAKIVATSVTVVGITYVTIVVGELVPKRLGQIFAEDLARLIARPIRILSIVSRPFVTLLTVSTFMLFKITGIKDSVNSDVTEDDITALLAEGNQAGVIEQDEHDMIKNVFRLDDRKIGSLMVPGGDIVFLELDDPIDVNMRIVSETSHSKFPVCRGGIQNVLGVITTKQMFVQINTASAKIDPDLTSHLQPAVYVPDSLTGMELLHQFKQTGAEMVFVIDEYGEIKGLVTLKDVMEAVTGEFKSNDPNDSWAVQRSDGTWLLDGLIPIMELKDVLNIRDLPDEDKGRYQTLSGLVMMSLGKLPHEADTVIIGQWKLEVVDLDGKRVDKVLATCMSDDCYPEA